MAFCKRLIEHEMDRRLGRTRGGGGRGSEALCRAQGAQGGLGLFSSAGAGRVEDTYNLLEHALKKALGVIAGRQG